MLVRLSQWCLLFGTVVWPAALFVFLSSHPGTVPPPRAPSSRDRPVPERTAPPTDIRGSRVVLSEGEGGQRASIFWQVPEPGHLHVTIEIPPPDSKQESAQPPDSNITP